MKKETLQHFSIRKLSVGAASVLIGLSFLGASQLQVKADVVHDPQSQTIQQSNEKSHSPQEPSKVTHNLDTPIVPGYTLENSTPLQGEVVDHEGKDEFIFLNESKNGDTRTYLQKIFGKEVVPFLGAGDGAGLSGFNYQYFVWTRTLTYSKDKTPIPEKPGPTVQPSDNPTPPTAPDNPPTSPVVPVSPTTPVQPTNSVQPTSASTETPSQNTDSSQPVASHPEATPSKDEQGEKTVASKEEKVPTKPASKKVAAKPIFKKLANNAPVKETKAELPQTGESKEETILAIGVATATVGGLIGLGYKAKKNDK
ncbi:YSIRK-type signal peptide-containing protein [Lactobacillus sp. HT06-2]|uniref:YSIRK-type signal peptide-containing protein n=1 Tax=Lactobacillus sp. HT06-2 TaxID=2080222 RepID=UPI001F2D80BD|nr:YSIRK-type signal peptide-containing protein [Lactobacillus sp. HT06-2]